MSDKRDQPIDPRAQGRRTVPDADPDATISGPLAADDPDATLSGPMAAFRKLGDQDPEDTLKPMPRRDDPDATVSGGALFDPDATVSSPGARRRANPFAPKALPEALQANLAALGGLNPLIAFANPILSAVPQIRAAQKHPDPALLKETLQDLVEAFEAGAGKSGASEDVLEASTYALCCLADDAAASTVWGRDWETAGLLHKLRGEDTGGEEFFALLSALTQKPEANAHLLELMYVCLALGFEGRYRGMPGGRPQLDKVRSDLHALVTRRRGRPQGGLSARWRGVQPGSMPKQVTPASPRKASAGFLWRSAGGTVAVLLALVFGYKAMEKPAPAPVAMSVEATPTPTPTPPSPAPTQAPAAAPTPAPAVAPHQILEQALAAEVQGGRVVLSQAAGRSVVTLRDPRQFGSAQVEPEAGTRALVDKIGAALETVPGPILVRGYSDSLPVHNGAFASNRELSAARAQSVAELLAARLSQPQRVSSEGAAEADPIAPNDTEQNRAKNRRVVILLGPKS